MLTVSDILNQEMESYWDQLSGQTNQPQTEESATETQASMPLCEPQVMKLEPANDSLEANLLTLKARQASIDKHWERVIIAGFLLVTLLLAVIPLLCYLLPVIFVTAIIGVTGAVIVGSWIALMIMSIQNNFRVSKIAACLREIESNNHPVATQSAAVVPENNHEADEILANAPRVRTNSHHRHNSFFQPSSLDDLDELELSDAMVYSFDITQGYHANSK
jgi:hypothetical protein